MLEQMPPSNTNDAKRTLPLTIVLSRGQSRNPDKRALEDAIIDGVSNRAGLNVLILPHLYDLAPNGEGYQHLRAIAGSMVVFSWNFGRATHWMLDRHDVRGTFGEIELKSEEDDDEEEDPADHEDDTIESLAFRDPVPDRRIYSIDLKHSNDPSDFLREVNRIFLIEGPHLAERFSNPTNDTSLSLDSIGKLALPIVPRQVDEAPSRRWYPVIDFSRCTNCMECIDFCLFGVYGVDRADTILVEQPDNCRKGCPACSRVCPANAIIFPQHKTPAIAGANVDVGGLKIDLSKLFGAPENDEDPMAAAERERNEQLILAGRPAVERPYEDTIVDMAKASPTSTVKNSDGLENSPAPPESSRIRNPKLDLPPPRAVDRTLADDPLDRLLDELDLSDL